MVNAGLVNGRESHLPPPLFRESFPVLGRISHFQNPFKYKRIREINHKTAHPASHPRPVARFSPFIPWHILPLRFQKGPFPIIAP